MKSKNPAMAGFLNVVFPGLGCAYLGRWFYALGYLIWAPLAWIAVMAIAGGIRDNISDRAIRVAIYYQYFTKARIWRSLTPKLR